MKRILVIIALLILPCIASGDNLLSGRILLQVQEKGEAWYVYPANQTRYFLGDPSKALQIMKNLGAGISNIDLQKIPIGILQSDCLDNDKDGLCNVLEDAIGTNKDISDTDKDGFDDKTEINNLYNPLGMGRQIVDIQFTQKNSGKIFLQVQKNGEAWYIDPVNQKRYFLGRPAEAFKAMQYFGLGITNTDLEEIPIGILPLINNISPIATSTLSNETIQLVANAIRSGDIEKTLSFFTENMHKSIEYSMKNMDKGDLLLLANILSGSSLQPSTDNKKTYYNEVYFQDEKHAVYFYIEKQSDGTWKMTNL